MISKNAKYRHYCDDITKIEGYEEAVSSPDRNEKIRKWHIGKPFPGKKNKETV